MKRIALMFALAVAAAACVASQASAGINGKLWLENDTDYKMHVWANNTDLGWLDPHTSGWVGDCINDPTFTNLHAQSDDGSRSWDETIIGQVENYN